LPRLIKDPELVLGKIDGHEGRINLNQIAALMVEEFFAEGKCVVVVVFQRSWPCDFLEDHRNDRQGQSALVSPFVAALRRPLQIDYDSVLEADCLVGLHPLQLEIVNRRLVAEAWPQFKLQHEFAVLLGSLLNVQGWRVKSLVGEKTVPWLC